MTNWTLLLLSWFVAIRFCASTICVFACNINKSVSNEKVLSIKNAMGLFNCIWSEIESNKKVYYDYATMRRGVAQRNVARGGVAYSTHFKEQTSQHAFLFCFFSLFVTVIACFNCTLMLCFFFVMETPLLLFVCFPIITTNGEKYLICFY